MKMSAKKEKLIIFIATRAAQLRIMSDSDIIKQAGKEHQRVLIALEVAKDPSTEAIISLFDEKVWLASSEKQKNGALLDAAELRAKLIEAMKGFEPSDCFIFFSGERDLVNVAEACKDLGAYSLDATKADFFRNKDKMKNYLKPFGISMPIHIHDFSSASYSSLVKSLDSPFVLKPLDGASSQGFKLIHDALEYQKFLDNTEDKENYSAESYIDGVLYHVESIVMDGKLIAQTLSEYAYPMAETLNGLPLFSILIPNPSSEQKKILLEDARVLEAFAIDGIFHAEYFLTSSGKVFFLEIAWRVAGEPVAINFKIHAGMDQISTWIGLKTGLLDPQSLPSNPPDFFRVMFLKQAGIYQGFELPIDKKDYHILEEIPIGSACESVKTYLNDYVAVLDIFADSYDNLYEHFKTLRTLGAIAQFKPKE